MLGYNQDKLEVISILFPFIHNDADTYVENRENKKSDRIGQTGLAQAKKSDGWQANSIAGIGLASETSLRPFKQGNDLQEQSDEVPLPTMISARTCAIKIAGEHKSGSVATPRPDTHRYIGLIENWVLVWRVVDDGKRKRDRNETPNTVKENTIRNGERTSRKRNS